MASQNKHLSQVVAARQDVSSQLRNANVTILLENSTLKKQVASLAATLALVQKELDCALDNPDGENRASMLTATELISHPEKALDQMLAEDAVNPWKSAVISELMVSHIYQAKHDTQPLKALHDLISHIDATTLDPAVSTAARNFGANILELAYRYLTTDGARKYNPEHHSLTGMARNFREFGVLVSVKADDV